jgi:hypothetical protein
MFSFSAQTGEQYFHEKSRLAFISRGIRIVLRLLIVSMEKAEMHSLECMKQHQTVFFRLFDL